MVSEPLCTSDLNEVKHLFFNLIKIYFCHCKIEYIYLVCLKVKHTNLVKIDFAIKNLYAKMLH